jgi:hypothetical protein
MKSRIASLGAVVAALLTWSIAGCAAAQSSERWRSSDGLVQLTTPAGWSVITDETRAADYPLILASPEMAARQEDCSALIIVSPRGPLPHDQAMLNDARSGLTAEGMFAAPDLVHAFQNEIVDGVRVISFDVERDGVRRLERHLQFSRRGERTEYVLACQVASDAAADLRASAEWLASLEIHR